MKHSMVMLASIMLTILSLVSIEAYAKPLEVGVILWRGETEADQAFIKKINNHFSDVKIHQIDVKQNIRETVKILNVTWKDKLENIDYLFSFGSRNTLQIRKVLLEKKFKGTLIGFGSASELELIHKNRALTKEKILFASTQLAPGIMFATFSPILHFKKIGVPYNLLEPQNTELLRSLKRIGLQNQIEIIPIRTKPDTKTLKHQLERALELIHDIDALYLPLDSFLLSHAKILNGYSKKLNILSIGANKRYVIEGVPLGLNSDYTELGEQLAKQVIAIENGASHNSLPIIRNQTGRIVANRKALMEHAPQLIDKLPANTLFIN